MEDVLTLKSASVLLGVSPSTVRRLADRGEIGSMRTPGGHRRVYRRDVEALRKQLQAEAAPLNPDEMHLR